MFVRTFLLAALALGYGAPAPGSGPSRCTVPESERALQLRLPYATFDTAPGQFGWRRLLARDCTDEAIALINAYGRAHPDLPSAALGEMAFHAGQSLLMAGRTNDSIVHFRRALTIGGTGEWLAYVRGHLAFAEHDLPELEKAVAAYARLAPGSMRWGFLEGMLACPAKSYMAAVSCHR